MRPKIKKIAIQYFERCYELPVWDDYSKPVYIEIFREQFLKDRMEPLGPDVPF